MVPGEGYFSKCEECLILSGGAGGYLCDCLVILVGLCGVLEGIGKKACPLEKDFLGIFGFAPLFQHRAKLLDRPDGTGILRPDLALPEEFRVGVDQGNLVEQVLCAILGVFGSLDHLGEPEDAARGLRFLREKFDLLLDLFYRPALGQFSGLLLDPGNGFRLGEGLAEIGKEPPRIVVFLVLLRLFYEAFECLETGFFIPPALEGFLDVGEIVVQPLELEVDLRKPWGFESQRGFQGFDRFLLLLGFLLECGLSDRSLDPRVDRDCGIVDELAVKAEGILLVVRQIVDLGNPLSHSKDPRPLREE